MQLATIPVRPPVKAPAYAAADRFSADLKALGASEVKATDSMTLEVNFPSTLDMVRANRVVNDTLYGAKLLWKTPPTGVFPAEPSVSDLIQTIRSLPEVTGTAELTGSPAAPTSFAVLTNSREGASQLSTLLRPEIDGHKLLVSLDGPVPPNA
jgi:hypothetical protein